MRIKRIWIPMTTSDFGAWLSYKWGAKFNYYIFIEGINVLLFMFFFLIAAIIMILTYKPTLGDFIANTKSTYLYAELITIGTILCLTAIISLLSNTKEKLIKNLKRIIIVTFIVIVSFIGIKTYLNNKYTEEQFNQIYEEKITDKKQESIYTIDFSVNSSSLIREKSEREIFIEQSLKAYRYFSIKANLLIIVMLSIFILEVYMIVKVNKKIKIEDRLEKDDNILEDDEINVKY